MDYNNESFDLYSICGENGKSDLYTWMNPEPSNPFNINQNNSPTFDDNIDFKRYYNSPSSFHQQNQQNSNNSFIANISENQAYKESQDKFAQSTISQKMEIEKEEPKEDIKDEEQKQDENKNIMDIEQTDLKNQQFINGNNIKINNDSLKTKLSLVEQIPIEENIKTKLFDYFTKSIEKITEGCDKISKKKEIILNLFEEEKKGKMTEALISILYPRRKDIIGNNDESDYIFNIPQYLEGLNSSPLKNKSDKKEMCITKIRKVFLTNLLLNNNNKDIHKKVRKKWKKKKKKKKKKKANNNSNNINKENNEKEMDSNLLYNILNDEEQINFSNYFNDKENQDNNEIIFQSSSFGNKSTGSNSIENVNNINEEDDEPIVRKDHLKNKLNTSSKNEFIDKFNEVNISYQIEKKDDDESEEESDNEEDDRKEKNKIIIDKNATNTGKKQNKNIIKLNININNKKKEKNEEIKEEEKKYLAFFDSSWEETILESKKTNPKFKDLNESEEAEEVMKMKRYKFLESLLNNEDKKKKFFDSQRKEYEEICKRDKCRIEANKIFENKNLDGQLIIVKYEKVRDVSINYKNKESFAEEIKKLKGFENFSLDLNDTDEKYIARHLEKLEKTANEIIKTLTEKNKHNEQSNNIIFE